jgi:hypothetical protein
MDGDEIAQTTSQPAPVPRTTAHDRESADPGHGEADPMRDNRTPSSGGGPSDLGLGGDWGGGGERRREGGATLGPVVGGATAGRRSPTTTVDNERTGGAPTGGGGSPPSHPWGSNAGVGEARSIDLHVF